MKKKESSSKSFKHKITTSTVKKTVSKSKLKPKQQPKQQQIFILLGDQFYVASSKTERFNYQQFQQKVKAKPQVMKKVQVKSGREASQSINLKQYVKSLSKAQKQQLFHDLQKEIQIEKEQVPQPPQNQSEDKLRKLNIKLQSIRGELMKGWQQQINKINHIFQNEQISLQDKNQKIMLVEKIRNNKLAMIDHISLLFEKIMLEDTELELNKQEHIEHIINSLNSFNSFSSMMQNPAGIEVAQSPFDIDVPYICKSEQHEKSKSEEDIQKQLFQEGGLQRKEENESPNVKTQKIYNCQEPSVFNHEHLRLDIRLDQVQFGKDHYQDDIILNNSEKIVEDGPKIQTKHASVLPNQQQPSDSVSNESKNSEQDSSLFDKKKLQQQFLCIDEQTDSKIKIPMLMTKDRLEQLQFQKIAKQKQALTIGIKSRMAYQLCETVPQNINHFTTLIDVNTFVVSFYQFVMQTFMIGVIQGLNLAYGKSSLDKLFQIRNEGFVPDYDNHNILPQDLLIQYHKQITLSVRKLSDVQKIHNKAIFQAFNTGLNVYRPYYELEGDVFPWNTSEKGLTFYQISQDNIQEVFQKSKIKVLQSCTNLCGVIPDCQLSTSQSKKELDKRNQDCYERVLKNQINQKFGDWYIKILNFQALSRLNLFDQIFEHEILLACYDLTNLSR